MTREQLAIGLAVLIAVLWTASLIADYFSTEYDVPASLHGLMMLAGGWCFGVGILKNGRRDD